MDQRANSIVLIGFMGAGKSSIGRALARMTGLPRFDTDELIARRFALTIPEIFEKHGEKKFREAETETLHDLAGKETGIIVTGGGIILSSENRQLVRGLGKVVHLAADEETLFERISRRSTRPLLQTENPRRTAANLLRVRLPLYREVADLEVDTSLLRHEEVASRILELIGS
ncbi:MAG TPA: shikimate kinase [Chthoniobacterales bacterium]|nr:shikimate kinase [Chthoniobacterales bacterium]